MLEKGRFMKNYKKLIFIVCMTCGSFAESNMIIDLAWVPSVLYDKIDSADFSKILSTTYAVDVADKRECTDEIGRNQEDDKKVKKVFTRSDIVGFIKHNTAFCLSKYGVEITEEKFADIIIKMEILEYYVLEKAIYKGILKTKITLLNKEGKVLAKTLTFGESKQWGKSFFKDYYLNVLSDCIIDNTKSILKIKM